MDGSFFSIDDTDTRASGDGVTAEFRAEVSQFLDEELTEDLARAARETTGLKSPKWACKAWQAALARKGWVAQSWPAEFGGTGWTPAQQRYFDQARADRDAPVVHSSGIRTIGPLIMAMGSKDQQRHYLPAILKGEHEWCQGYSEPQAGSDLTALNMRAERDGDDFILNGSKLWTSFAHEATHMFLLARSEPRSTGKDGLVFLLIEMDRPGIEINPIRFIDGECETNEVFFNNVRTPAANRIGEVGDGWGAARALMTIARSNNTPPHLIRRALRAAKRSTASLTGDPGLALRLAGLEMRLDAFDALCARKVSQADGPMDHLTASMLKVIATELQQAINETAVSGTDDQDLARARYFANRAATIYSGTSEVHRNTLARLIGC